MALCQEIQQKLAERIMGTLSVEDEQLVKKIPRHLDL